MSVLILLILAMIAFGGTYNIEEHYHPGMPDSYGMAIQSNATDRLWIGDFWTGDIVEFDMTTGNKTGNIWTCWFGPMDMTFREYEGIANQYLLGHFINNHIEIYDESTTGANPYLNGFIEGPLGWEKIYGLAASDDMIYVTTPLGGIIAWAAYTGVESSVSWTTNNLYPVVGLTVYGDYLFACKAQQTPDNILIYSINPDGSVNLDPIWSCQFDEAQHGPDGSIEYDGEFVWIHPECGDLYKLSIDWVPSAALSRVTWANIKSAF